MYRKFIFICLVFFSISLISANTLAQNNIRKNKVAKSAEDICPILVGEKIPDLILTDIENHSFDLNKALQEKPTVLVIYRGGWCPYCNRQLEGLRLVEPDLVSLGYQVIAVSIDRPAKLKETLDKHKMNYILLSDSSAKASTALGLAFKIDDKTMEIYKKYNVDLEGYSGEKHHILPVPTVFIIGKDGIIKFEYINPNYKVRLDSDLLLRAAKSYLK